MDTALTALSDRAGHLLRAWEAIFIGLWAATAATFVAVTAALLLTAPPDYDRWDALRQMPQVLLVVGLGAGLAALAFSILAIPLLMLHRFIVGPKPPYLRPGYLAVILYGPALLMLPEGRWQPGSGPTCALYEAIALLATLIYIRLSDRFDLFPPDPQPLARPSSTARA